MIRLWERFKGWRRGEKMLPGVNRGRAFVKKGAPVDPNSPPSNVIKIKKQPKIKLVGIKVIRADGTTEEIQ